MTHAARFRELLAGPKPIVIVGAHNGLSAKLAERAGFEGIWASGFEISAAYGIPDANILSVAEVLQTARQIVEQVNIPVIADCDNGFGNAVNVIHMIRQYESAGIAGVCMEDNVFPKRCSFYAGVKRELSSVEEHVGKIKAAKDAQKTRDFSVIARTEALIAGWGMEEALMRGRAYADAGADMVLIHSKSKKPEEVIAFAKAWDRKTPLVCVPTTYKDATVDQLSAAGFKMMIFANHGLRSSIKAMSQTFKEMRAKGTTSAADPYVVSLQEVYDVVGVSEMETQEKSFMPADAGGMTAVVLAAGVERNLMPLIEDKPRAMLDIRGKTILERQIDVLNRCDIKDIAVVRGYKKDQITVPNIRTYDNDEYETTGEAVSLFRAAAELDKRVVVLYGDVLFDQSILEKMMRSDADITLVVDRALKDMSKAERTARPRDYVIEDAPQATASDRFVPADGTTVVKKIGANLDPEKANGEFIGMAMLTEKGCRLLRDAWARAAEGKAGAPVHEAPKFQVAKLTDILQTVIDAGGEVHAVDIYKGWMEIDTFEDYQRAWSTIR